MLSSALKDLTTPGMAQLGLLFEVVADIRRLDRPGTSDAAFRSGVRSAIAERLPPVPDIAWPPVRLAPGADAADAAAAIAALLARHAGPATPLLARLAGGPVAVETAAAAHRALTAGEAALLDARHGTRAYEREGEMTAGELAVAQTRLVLIPDRLPAAAWEQIQDGQPAGDALGPYGMRRIDRKTCLSRAAALVDASAVLCLGDVLIGTAAEHITPGFCGHVAAMAG
jgi:hypothetical protein